MRSLEGKVAVITGAAGGLGSALCRAFSEAGCRLFLTDIHKERLQLLMAELQKSGATATGEGLDLATPASARIVIGKAVEAYGRIDILVNNAGVSRAKGFFELTEEDWDSVLNINLKALFFTMQAGAKEMMGGGGSIINIASVAGRLPRPTLMHYAASKAAVISLTRSAALALGPNNVRVNAIAPGMMDTEMLQVLREDMKAGENGSGAGQPNLGIVPLGRIAQPEEIADAVLFLASEEARYITGQTLNVCGGISMN
jgi:NAD(P)-dependent dehydrogenase (short-subunit alcohol dehydrogenase family)